MISPALLRGVPHACPRFLFLLSSPLCTGVHQHTDSLVLNILRHPAVVCLFLTRQHGSTRLHVQRALHHSRSSSSAANQPHSLPTSDVRRHSACHLRLPRPFAHHRLCRHYNIRIASRSLCACHTSASAHLPQTTRPPASSSCRCQPQGLRTRQRCPTQPSAIVGRNGLIRTWSFPS